MSELKIVALHHMAGAMHKLRDIDEVLTGPQLGHMVGEVETVVPGEGAAALHSLQTKLTQMQDHVGKLYGPSGGYTVSNRGLFEGVQRLDDRISAGRGYLHGAEAVHVGQAPTASIQMKDFRSQIDYIRQGVAELLPAGDEAAEDVARPAEAYRAAKTALGL